MRSQFLICAFFALLGTPAISVAGPIDINLATTNSVNPGTPSPGTVTVTFTTQGNVQVSPGDGGLGVGSIHFLPPEGPQSSSSYTATSTYDVSIKVTDTASGQSGTFQVEGSAVDQWVKQDSSGTWTNTFHALETGNWLKSTPYTANMTLGGNNYVLQVATIQQNTLSEFTLFVNPDASITTPEPASLLLGAIALLPVGMRAVRRRKGLTSNETT